MTVFFTSDSQSIFNYRNFIMSMDKIVIFSPYIKESAIKTLLEGSESKVETIITTWKPMDLAIGVTDLSIYPYCKKYNIQLLINNRIHLKSIVSRNFGSCTISSANLTNKGLALSNNYNFELGTIKDNLSIEEKCYFDSIIDNSILVTDDYYMRIKEQVENIPEKILDVPEEFVQPPKEERCLSSELPYFDKPQDLFDVITNRENYSEEEIRSAIHDLRLYNVINVNNQQQLITVLRKEFRNHFFIKEFLKFNSDGKRFGELTAWLHDKIENVPSPKRYEVKEYLQRIYTYIGYLLEDEFQITIPGRHSQVLQRISKYE